MRLAWSDTSAGGSVEGDRGAKWPSASAAASRVVAVWMGVLSKVVASPSAIVKAGSRVELTGVGGGHEALRCSLPFSRGLPSDIEERRLGLRRFTGESAHRQCQRKPAGGD